ncbi:MAG: RNA polymerase sigma factor [Planctomycetes bacterium]|nr:RNA polymerase sigma factor [Planctomycetota bacterium]
MNVDDDSSHDRMESLIRLAQQGDPEALASLYRLYEHDLTAEVRRKLGPVLRSRMESVDLVQSLWADVLDDLKNFKDHGPGSFLAWLNTCLGHKIQEKGRFYKAAKRDVKRAVRIRDGDTQSTGASLPAGDDPTPSRVAMGYENLERLVRVLDTFNDLQRRILILRLRDEKEYEEIGALIGKSADATRKLCGRSLAELKKRLEIEDRQASKGKNLTGE